MRIAIDARYIHGSFSAMAKYGENLLAHLSALDNDNQYVVFSNPNYQRRLRVGDNFEIVHYKPQPISLRSMFRLGRKIAGRQCDFLHSLGPAAPLFNAPQTILTLHSLNPLSFDAGAPKTNDFHYGHFASLLYHLSLPHYIRKATWILCVSYAIRDALVQHFPETEGKALVAYPGVETIFHNRPESTITQMVSNKMDLPAQYVLYIGSAREKNLPDMLRAFAKCVDSSRESLGRVHLLLASGNAPEQNSLMETARELDIEKQVRILGPLTEEEKHVLYDQALALFSVGCPEKFDITILEAQAAGLPVLASDEKSAREITDDSALLVDHDDVDAMASELTKLLQDASLRERLAGAGKKNAQRFNWQNTAQKVLDIYKLLM